MDLVQLNEYLKNLKKSLPGKCTHLSLLHKHTGDSVVRLGIKGAAMKNIALPYEFNETSLKYLTDKIIEHVGAGN